MTYHFFHYLRPLLPLVAYFLTPFPKSPLKFYVIYGRPLSQKVIPAVTTHIHKASGRVPVRPQSLSNLKSTHSFSAHTDCAAAKPNCAESPWCFGTPKSKNIYLTPSPLPLMHANTNKPMDPTWTHFEASPYSYPLEWHPHCQTGTALCGLPLHISC